MAYTSILRGSSHLSDDSLLFLTDVDMLISCDALRRIQLNTIYKAQVYFTLFSLLAYMTSLVALKSWKTWSRN